MQRNCPVSRPPCRRRGAVQRYQDAAWQLGHDKPAVRLAGIYAMSRLADDWVEQRQACIESCVLTCECHGRLPRHVTFAGAYSVATACSRMSSYRRRISL